MRNLRARISNTPQNTATPNSMKIKSAILIADDDSDDCYLIQLAFKDCNIDNPIVFFKNGLEVMQYIQKKSDNEIALIILDLNMPKMDGKITLSKIKTNPSWKRVPVVVLTTSTSKQDIGDCYDSGANGFISKPSSYDDLQNVVKAMSKMWLSYE